MTLPVEAVPDGSVSLPHHLYIGAVLALLVCGVVWDNDADAEPLGVTAGVLVALFGFGLVWNPYAAVGAGLTLGGLLAALMAFVFRRDYWGMFPKRIQSAACLGLLVSLDDVLSHMFGIWTPLDAVWSAFILPVVA